MILIGQYDSPFVRRVAVALTIYGMDFEHRPWSVFGDSDRLGAINPLKRVPTFICDDGEVLTESAAILDWIDDVFLSHDGAGDKALIARSGIERRQALKVCALSTGFADKAVSLVYERVVHERGTQVWVDRCRSQIAGVLDWLEADRVRRGGAWWFGAALTHADIAAGCALRFLSEAHPGVFDPARWPALAAHSARCEAHPAFAAVVQPFYVAPPSA